MCTDHPHGHDHGHGHGHGPDDPVGRVRPVPLDDWRGPGEVLPLEPVDAVRVTVLCDNVYDGLLLDQGPARRIGLGGGREGPPPTVPCATLEAGEAIDALEAQHGFSAMLDVVKGGSTHRFLFDTGMTPTGMVDNMRRLGLDPGDVEVLVMSHGHFDHCTGLDGFVQAVGRPNVPVLLHPEFWTRRRINVPGRTPFELPSTSKRALLEAGFEVIEQERPSFLFERSVLVTGEVPRTTDFEVGFAVHEAERDEGWEPDPLILDDQALVVNVRDRGLVVVTGCGHAGVVNTCRYAQRLTGVDRLHAVIGGFHLNGPLFEPVIPPTVEAFEDLAPEWLVPTHCTGWKATHALAARLPDAFLPSSVGTEFVL